jgi:hypothetical protein
MQRSRRTNPYPFTWEIPVALTVAALLLLLIGVQGGRSFANLIAGNGWHFVDRAQLFSSLSGIFAGNSGAGLTDISHLVGPGLLWSCIGVLELVVLVACAVALKWSLHRWGPGRLQGMATRSEAEALLGTTRLRKHAKVIRPDLYGPSKGGVR